MGKILFSPDALEDLKATRSYIAEELCDEAAAENTVRTIMQRLRQLSDFPESGAPLRSMIHMESAYRFLVCGHYIAFYRVENGDVYVVRILYHRRNFMQILFGKSDGNAY